MLPARDNGYRASEIGSPSTPTAWFVFYPARGAIIVLREGGAVVRRQPRFSEGRLFGAALLRSQCGSGNQGRRID